jgi:hypothetical protein
MVLAVYRARNGSVVDRAIHEARRLGWPIRLWALDEPVDWLRELTLGSGPGGKMALLSHLLEPGIPNDVEWLVVLDDDAVVVRGSIRLLLNVASRSGFVLCQPSHDRTSFFTYGITLRRPASIARLTTFVDIGPLVAIRRSHEEQLGRLGADPGMGWGLSAAWTDLARQGQRLGIVDVVSVRHLRPPGSGYALEEPTERLRGMLRDRGVGSPLDLQRTISVWRPWQHAPPWLDRA